jgi:hypothetical protein
MEPSQVTRLGGRTAFVAVCALLAIAIARIAATYPLLSATMDEPGHIATAVELYQGRMFTAVIGQPPLPRLPTGLLLYSAGARTLPGEDLHTQEQYVMDRSLGYWRTLTLGRIGTLFFLPILCFYCYRWSFRLYGRVAALIAVALVTCSPSVLAHAGLATVDFSITAMLVAASYHLYRWFEEPEISSALVAGWIAGLALMAKYSTVGFLPPILAAFFLLARRQQLRNRGAWNIRVFRAGLLQAMVFVAMVFLAVWACFLVNKHPVGTADQIVRTVDRYFSSGTTVNHLLTTAAMEGRKIAPGFLEGLWKQVDHAGFRGHEWNYLFGELREGEGWWYYFPIAIGVKSTLPFLLLLLLACAMLWVRRRQALWRGSLYVFTAAALILLVCMPAKVNIGIRHILPIYAFLAILASSLFSCRANQFRVRRPILIVSFALVAGHAVASVAAHPDYLAYFNELGRGKEHQILGDSNLDWGQDLHRLGQHLDAHGIEEINLNTLGRRPPALAQIRRVRGFGPADRPKGWVAVSVSKLQGIMDQPGQPSYAWLLKHEPRAIIGRSIWLYYLEP